MRSEKPDLSPVVGVCTFSAQIEKVSYYRATKSNATSTFCAVLKPAVLLLLLPFRGGTYAKMGDKQPFWKKSIAQHLQPMYNTLKSDGFTDEMALAFATADLAGRFDVVQESKNG